MSRNDLRCLAVVMASLGLAGCGGSGSIDSVTTADGTATSDTRLASEAATVKPWDDTVLPSQQSAQSAPLKTVSTGATQSTSTSGSAPATQTVTPPASVAMPPLGQCPVDYARTTRDLGAALSIIRTMPANSWQRVNQNAFASVQAPVSLQPSCTSIGGPNAIVNAWGGFAYDSNRGDLLTFGGGHADYCGNDVYRFRLATLSWERAGLSSQMKVWQLDSTTQTGIPVDGLENAPMTSHMYDHLNFMPSADRMIYFGGRPFWGGSNAPTYDGLQHPHTGPWLFDPTKADGNKVVGTTGSAADPAIIGGRMWENREYASNHPGSYLPASYGITASSATVCSAGRDVVFMRAATAGSLGSVLIKYEVPSLASRGQDSLVQLSSNTNHMGQADMAVDPERAIAVLIGDSNSRPLAFWDLNAAGSRNPLQTITGLTSDGSFSYSNKYGMDFDVSRGRFLIWNGESTVWELRPPNETRVSQSGWQVTRLIASGGPAGELLPSGGGANGKWKYAPDLDVFIGLREAPGGDVWIYKPDGWRDPASR